MTQKVTAPPGGTLSKSTPSAAPLPGMVLPVTEGMTGQALADGVLGLTLTWVAIVEGDMAMYR